MRVMVLVKADGRSESGEMPSERQLTEMMQYNEELAKAGILLAGDGLHPSSRGMRVNWDGGNVTVTDGPFTEAKELVAGYWLWEVKSMEEAVEWARRIPAPADNGIAEVEIRPVFEADDFGDAMTPEVREQEQRLRAQTSAKQ